MILRLWVWISTGCGAFSIYDVIKHLLLSSFLSFNIITITCTMFPVERNKYKEMPGKAQSLKTRWCWVPTLCNLLIFSSPSNALGNWATALPCSLYLLEFLQWLLLDPVPIVDRDPGGFMDPQLVVFLKNAEMLKIKFRRIKLDIQTSYSVKVLTWAVQLIIA